MARKGAGKSTRVLRDLERVDRSRSVFLWDPEGWFPATIGGRRYTESSDPAAWLADRRRGREPFAVRFVGAPTESAHWLVAIAWGCAGSLVVFDDATNLMPYGVAARWLRTAVTTARHRAVSLWFVGHSPTLLDKTIIRNSDRAELGALGFEPDRIALHREFRDDRILALDRAAPGHFLTFTR